MIVYIHILVLFFFIIDKEIAKKRVKVENKPILPFPKNQDTQKQDTQKQDTQNQDTYNTNRTNINSHSFYQEQENLNTVDENHLEEKELDIREIERDKINSITCYMPSCLALFVV